MLIYLCLLSCKTFISVYCYMDFGVNFLSTVTLCHYYSGDNVSSITFWPLFFFPYSCIIFLRFSVKARSHPYLLPLLTHRKAPPIPLPLHRLCHPLESQQNLASQFQIPVTIRHVPTLYKDMRCTGPHTRRVWRMWMTQDYIPGQYQGHGLHGTTH